MKLVKLLSLKKYFSLFSKWTEHINICHARKVSNTKLFVVNNIFSLIFMLGNNIPNDYNFFSTFVNHRYVTQLVKKTTSFIKTKLFKYVYHCGFYDFSRHVIPTSCIFICQTFLHFINIFSENLFNLFTLKYY